MTHSNSSSTEPMVERLHVEELPAKPRLRAVTHEPVAHDPRLDVLIDELRRAREQIAELGARPVATGDATLFQTMLAAFTALGYALSARAILLLALIGAFVLAVRAQTAMDLGVLIAYALFAIVPVVVLEIRKVLK